MPIVLNRRGNRAYPAHIDTADKAVLLPKKSSEKPGPEFLPEIFNQEFSFREFLELGPNAYSQQYPNSLDPTSDFSFDQFIEENYMTTRAAGIQAANIQGQIESFSDSESDSIRSISPSVCATAIRVKITPLRAVRRSIRRSFRRNSRVQETNTPDEQQAFCWGPYKSVLNVLQRRGRLDPSNVDPAVTETNPPNDTSTFSELKETFHPSFPARSQNMGTQEKGSFLIMDSEKHSNITSSQRLAPVRPLANIRRSASFSGRSSLPYNTVDKDRDFEMMGFHDVTREAAEMATMMSYRWKFEPVADVSHNGDGNGKPLPRRASH